ncbi:MAG: calcium-binding protein [Gaiellaceae bacterium]
MRPGYVLIGVVLALTAVPTAAAERMVGNSRDNRIHGTGARDVIYGRNGDDVLSGRGGRDLIDGEEGNDVIVGGAGRDTLYGRGLDDTINGGPNHDTIYPGFGPDVVYGGGGNDNIVARDRDERMDTIDCGPGRDRVVFRRGDRVINCEIRVRRPGPKLPGTYMTGRAAQDDWKGLEDLAEFYAGLGGDDILAGWAGDDVLWGNEGNDDLFGDNGGDWLIGSAGRDRLYGGPGRDRLWGGPGLDRLYGDAQVVGDEADDGQRDLLFSVEDDGVADVVRCGQGDRAVVRAGDTVQRKSRCARVRVIRRG